VAVAGGAPGESVMVSSVTGEVLSGGSVVAAGSVDASVCFSGFTAGLGGVCVAEGSGVIVAGAVVGVGAGAGSAMDDSLGCGAD